MERMTEKHYLGTDHYMKCSGNCNVDIGKTVFLTREEAEKALEAMKDE